VNTPNSKKAWSAAYTISARPRAEHAVNRMTFKETCEPTLHSSSSQQLTLQVTPLYSPQPIIAVLQPTWLVQEFDTKVALSFLRNLLIHLSYDEPQSIKYLLLSPSRVLFLQSSSVPLHIYHFKAVTAATSTRKAATVSKKRPMVQVARFLR